MGVMVGGHGQERFAESVTHFASKFFANKWGDAIEYIRRRLGGFVGQLPEIRPEFFLDNFGANANASQRAPNGFAASDAGRDRIRVVFVGSRKDKSVRVKVGPKPTDVFAEQFAGRKFAFV